VLFKEISCLKTPAPVIRNNIATIDATAITTEKIHVNTREDATEIVVEMTKTLERSFKPISCHVLLDFVCGRFGYIGSRFRQFNEGAMHSTIGQSWHGDVAYVLTGQPLVG
jgi:hypothetical protein